MRWGDNFKIMVGFNWTQLAQDRVTWRDLEEAYLQHGTNGLYKQKEHNYLKIHMWSLLKKFEGFFYNKRICVDTLFYIMIFVRFNFKIVFICASQGINDKLYFFCLKKKKH